jgi:hypothetical protein
MWPKASVKFGLNFFLGNGWAGLGPTKMERNGTERNGDVVIQIKRNVVVGTEKQSGCQSVYWREHVSSSHCVPSSRLALLYHSPSSSLHPLLRSIRARPPTPPERRGEERRSVKHAARGRVAACRLQDLPRQRLVSFGLVWLGPPISPASQ